MSSQVYSVAMTSSEERPQFSRNLIAARKRKGVSQRDLAKLSGLSPRMIAYYETQAVIPPIDKLNTIAAALEVSLSELVAAGDENENIRSLNTRTLKKVMLLEQLPPEDQRKVVDYINLLIDQNKLKNLKTS